MWNVSSLNALYKMIVEGNLKVKDIAGKDLVFVIGNTGAGKSTTIGYLMGVEFVSSKMAGRIVALPKQLEKILDPQTNKEYLVDLEGRKYPLIGHRLGESQTLYPEVFQAGELYLCDCAGFFDTRSEIEGIAASLNLQHAMNAARSIKLLIIINYAELQAARGTAFTKLIELLSKLFNDFNQIIPNLYWIVSQVPNEIDENDIKEQLIGEGGFAYTLKNLVNTSFHLSTPAKSAFEKDKDLIHAQLKLINFMANNLTIINVLKDSDRKKIMVQLSSQPSISANQLSFLQYEAPRLALAQYVRNFIGQLRQLANNKLKHQAALQFFTFEKQLIEKEIKKTDKINLRLSQNSRKHQINITLLDIKNKQLIAVNDSLESSQKEITALDTDEEIIIKRFVVQYTLKWYERFYYLSSTICHSDEPFETYRENIRTGYIGKREVDAMRGHYKAIYYTNWGENADMSIELVIRKKNKRDNATRIKCLRENIAQLERTKTDLELDIFELQGKIKLLRQIQQENITRTQTQLSLQYDKLRNLRLKLQETKDDLQETNDSIQQSKILFLAIDQFISVLQTPLSSDSILAKNIHELASVYETPHMKKEFSPLYSLSKLGMSSTKVERPTFLSHNFRR